MVVAKKFVYARCFKGAAEESNFRLEEESLPDLRDGEALFEAVYLSVDPYMRVFVKDSMLNTTMMGEQVAKVIESKNAQYPVGSYVKATFGWRTHSIGPADGVAIRPLSKADFEGLPLSLGLGTLGMTGATAHMALMRDGKPKPGETLLVNGAAGAVGSIVGQIAKIKGLKVIGCAGTDAKCDWLRELGFDYVFNYKTSDLSKTLTEAAPDGIDIYFDNVGGQFSATVFQKHMRSKGRVVVVGGISEYDLQKPSADPFQSQSPNARKDVVVNKQFQIFSEPDENLKEPLKEMTLWVRQGKLKYKETVTEGFENMPKAFIGMMSGQNVGKAVVKV